METDAVLDLIQEVAEKVITPRFRDLGDGDVSEKGPGDLVTVADRESERLLTRRLLDAYPRAVVLGEEAYAARPRLLEEFRAADHAFTVDPVDGTKNFVKGSPDHAVMVAEVRGGETVRGWIWQPQHELAYVAEHGAGAWRNGERITRPAPPADPAEWRGVTSKWRWLGRSLGDLKPLKLTWVCCGVDYPKLVEGEADFVVYGRALPWDHAPGSLLLSEAGGHSGTHDGTTYRPVDPIEAGGRPNGLVTAADRATYDHVVSRLG
ncbi:MAG TPA: inositol monophosphatase [Nocardioides sp.]|nr:inositol monophosphatase [Nocardioides sp.]